jgi:GTP cyclohydrolase I
VDNDEMVIEKDITFYSMCEHHLLPFYGRAHVAYIPDGKVVGLSKLARTVDIIAKRPQIQEKMTAQIADALMVYLKPKGALVMLEAEHMCMTMRGIKKPGSKTVTMALRGEFQTDKELKEDFFRLMGNSIC